LKNQILGEKDLVELLENQGGGIYLSRGPPEGPPVTKLKQRKRTGGILGWGQGLGGHEQRRENGH